MAITVRDMLFRTCITSAYREISIVGALLAGTLCHTHIFKRMSHPDTKSGEHCEATMITVMQERDGGNRDIMAIPVPTIPEADQCHSEAVADLPLAGRGKNSWGQSSWVGQKAGERTLKEAHGVAHLPSLGLVQLQNGDWHAGRAC